MKCLFCGIVSGEIPSFKIWENEEFLAFLDINPINPGHVLLIPKTHAEDVFDLPQGLFGNFFKSAREIAPFIKDAARAKRVGMAVEGFGIPHVHVHLVPVNNGNELNPERAKKASNAELLEMQAAITKALTQNRKRSSL